MNTTRQSPVQSPGLSRRGTAAINASQNPLRNPAGMILKSYFRIESQKPLTRPSDTLSPSDGERDGVRDGVRGRSKTISENRFIARTPSTRSGFTLIEIMLVVGLMALIAATAVPNIYQLTKKEGLRRAVSDLKDVCSNARARAIFSGEEVSVMFYPGERLFAISSKGGREFDPVTGETKAEPMTRPGSGTTGIFPEDVNVEMLDINQHSALEYDWARVRFYPNGTSEELVINLSSRDEPGLWLKLDPATSILIIGEPP